MIPDFQTIMLPLLRYSAGKGELSLKTAVDALADKFELSDAERDEMLPSGRQQTMYNRVTWARTYLAKAGLLDMTKRAHFRITPKGDEVLQHPPDKITIAYLQIFPEFVAFRQANVQHLQQSKQAKQASNAALATDQEPETLETETPEELLEHSYQKLRDALAEEVLKTVQACTPAFFEQLVVDLLVKMGYGGSRKEAGEAVGKSSDGGIDGIIKEDRLGLDIIYLQAKKWEGAVGRPEIQKFAGALQGQRARKGVFITTSRFSKEAQEYVKQIETKIILIDGVLLTELMFEHNVGVTPVAAYEVKRVDLDYFGE